MEKQRVRLGVIVPSSNTVIEPLAQQIVESLNQDKNAKLDVSVHFARVRVTTIALSADADAQFALAPFLEAARLLADARVDVIGWGGTSASWLGFATDDVLCAAITKETRGIPATTAVKGMNDLLRSDRGKARGAAAASNGQDQATRDEEEGEDQPAIGLVTPYTANVNAAIQANYARMGFVISDDRSRYAGLSDNFAFAELGERQLDDMVSDVAVRGGAKTVLIMCTNVRAARAVVEWERAYGIRVLDSVATTVYAMLALAGVDIKNNEAESVAELWGSPF